MSYPGLPERLAQVRERIADACARAGRDPAGVRIVAVTKTHPVDAVDAVLAAGLTDVAENRVQELETKVTGLAGESPARWHLIGHLQRNKARRAVELCEMIQSIDSVRIGRKLSATAADLGRDVEALIQVNVAGEESKGGLEGEAMRDEMAEICAMPGLRVRGLMTMAPFTDDEKVIRSVFAATRELLDGVAASVGMQGRELSMGMSGDFELAVEEGSTIVRLGTVLFGERER